MSTLANAPSQETKTMTQRSVRRRRIGKILGPYFFLLPASLFLLLFLVYPVINMIVYSFEQVNVGSLLTGITPFVGLDNYRTVLSDPSFRSSLVVSLIFTIASLVFQYILGFAMALLFNRRIPLVGMMRGSVMIAWMLPVIVSATIFKWMLQRDSGIVNYVLQSFHVVSSPVDWLTNPNLALLAVIGANIWIGIPFNMSLLLAGLQGISETLYEAAVVDGANGLRRFLHITLPLMRSTSLTILMLGFIYTLNVFDLIYVLTGGGPVNATEAMPLYAYRIAFGQFDLGSGAAVATLMFLLLLGISAIYLFLLRREEVA